MTVLVPITIGVVFANLTGSLLGVGGIYSHYNKDKGVPVLSDPSTSVTQSAVYDRSMPCSTEQHVGNAVWRTSPFFAPQRAAPTLAIWWMPGMHDSVAICCRLQLRDLMETDLRGLPPVATIGQIADLLKVLSGAPFVNRLHHEQLTAEA